jgi:hypothetical protein
MAPKPSLKMLYTNCNSLTGKVNLIQSSIETYCPDLIALTETKINDTYDDNELFGDNYTVWRQDRNIHGGEVLIAIKNNPDIKIIDSNHGPGESLTLIIQIHQKIKFNLILFHRPPHEYSLDNLIEIVDTNITTNCIYLGDYNLPDLDWKTDPGNASVKNSSNRKALHQLALDTFNEADLKQQIHNSTHKFGNTLDLVMLNKLLLNDIDIKCQILPGISDHNMLLIDITAQDLASVFTVPPKKIYRNYDRANYAEIETTFNSLKTHIMETPPTEVEECWTKFLHCLNTAVESIPGKLSKPMGHPWINRSIVRKIRKRGRIFDKNEKFPSIAHQRELDLISRDIIVQVKEAKTKYLDVHLTGEMEHGNTKPLFNYLNKNTGHSNQISLIDTEADRIPDKLADTFSTVFEKIDYRVPVLDKCAITKMPDVKISSTGVKNLLVKLDKRKASGPDDIAAITLKMFAENVPSFIDCVCILFETSLKEGAVPKVWKRATICPIYKGGKRSDPHHYRPISLTCILCKTLEHVICSNMWSHIENAEIIKDNQHGFRKGLNTTTQLLHVVHFAAEAIDKQNDYHMVSFDFSKAFDRVPHNLLLHKLVNFNFDVNCVAWIKDWLKNRTSRVAVNGSMSYEFDIHSGVPQGSVLGPLLFILYVNDISDEIKFSECRLYADDTVLCSNLSQRPDGLQNDINALYQWGNKWGMQFNLSKCAHMQFGKASPTIRLKLGDSCIPNASTIKYLGVHIDSDLKWNTHVTKTVAKANRSLGLIKRNLREAPTKTKLVAFNSVVRPILEYASQVWSPHQAGLSKSIDMVQRKAMRWIYWIRKRDSVTECMNRHSIVSLSDRRKDLDILFLRKTEAGLFDLNLNCYIRFSTDHNTRGKTISWTHRTNAWRFSYFNRIRHDIKVIFPPSP